ncbi:protein of unknown function [Paraburkholderia kururiensis]
MGNVKTSCPNPFTLCHATRRTVTFMAHQPMPVSTFPWLLLTAQQRTGSAGSTRFVSPCLSKPCVHAWVAPGISLPFSVSTRRPHCAITALVACYNFFLRFDVTPTVQG